MNWLHDVVAVFNGRYLRAMGVFPGYMFFVTNRPGAALELVAVEVLIRKVYIFAELGRTTVPDTSALLARVLR